MSIHRSPAFNDARKYFLLKNLDDYSLDIILPLPSNQAMQLLPPYPLDYSATDPISSDEDTPLQIQSNLPRIPTTHYEYNEESTPIDNRELSQKTVSRPCVLFVAIITFAILTLLISTGIYFSHVILDHHHNTTDCSVASI